METSGLVHEGTLLGTQEQFSNDAWLVESSEVFYHYEIKFESMLLNIHNFVEYLNVYIQTVLIYL